VKWRFAAVAFTAITALVTAVGCSHTVGGTAHPALPGVPDAGRSYGYVDNRCGLLLDSSVQETLAADQVVRPYSGAVCQYVLARQNRMIDVTLAWYETGTLERERAVAEQREAKISDTVVERHKAFLASTSTTGAACSATAAANPGVLSWWVQIRGQSSGDPCKDAQKLLAATLSSDL
jgi:hypothetical protein